MNMKTSLTNSKNYLNEFDFFKFHTVLSQTQIFVRMLFVLEIICCLKLKKLDDQQLTF